MARATKRSDMRERIIETTLELMTEGGIEAVSTRAVSARAGIQAQTLYRQFGDMRGLLDETAGAGFESYVRSKVERPPNIDPVDDLRDGWDLHVEFGLANPDLYRLMYADINRIDRSDAAREAESVLRGLVETAARAGRLTVTVERAVALISSAGVGVVLEILSTEPALRDADLPSLSREMVLAAITDTKPDSDQASDATGHAIALRASLAAEPAALSPGESLLLDELLEKLATNRHPTGARSMRSR